MGPAATATAEASASMENRFAPRFRVHRAAPVRRSIAVTMPRVLAAALKASSAVTSSRSGDPATGCPLIGPASVPRFEVDQAAGSP